MKKLMFLGAGAVGYVLGAKAGRERYEQISRQAQKLRTNPTVRQKVNEAKHAAKDAAGTAADKVRNHGSDSGEPGSTPYAGTAANGFGRGDEGF